MATHSTKKKSIDELRQELIDIRQERERFMLEREVAKAKSELRNDVLTALEEDVTLDDILEECMKNGLCKKISVWTTTED